MDSVGEGEGGKIWENGIETCEMSSMKRDARKKKKNIGKFMASRPLGEGTPGNDTAEKSRRLLS